MHSDRATLLNEYYYYFLPDAAKGRSLRLANLCGLTGSPPRRSCARLTYEVSQDMHPPARKPQKCEDDMLELLPAGLWCCYRLVDLYTRSATYTGPKGS